MENQAADTIDAVDQILDRLTVDCYGHNALRTSKRRRLMVERSSKRRPNLIVMRRVPVAKAKPY